VEDEMMSSRKLTGMDRMSRLGISDFKLEISNLKSLTAHPGHPAHPC
jgi:hypothetical protein